GMLGFLCPPRSTTTPATPMQNSPRSSPARPCACALVPGSNTTWVRPPRSRRSMNTQPPWSRRAATQPNNTARFPASLARSAPQSCVRFRSTRTSDMRGLYQAGAGARVDEMSATLDPCLAHGDRMHILIPSENMRLRVLYHGNCFDGCSSAGVFTRFYRERIAKGPVEVVYRPLEHKGSPQPFSPDCFDGDENACVDFRYSQDPRLTWWFDHQASAFQS